MTSTIWLVVGVVACTSSHEAPAAPKGLPPGPVAVALPTVAPAQLRTLTSTVGFVTIDARGALGWGRPKPGPAPFATVPLPRLSSPFAAIDADDNDPTATVRPDGQLEYDLDVYAVLSHDTRTDALLLADKASPARIAIRDAINHFGYRRVAIAAGAANTAVLYQFGGDPWQPPDDVPDLALRTDQIDKLAGQHPKRVMLEITDATTMGELVTALAAVAQTGAPNLRVHRMMGWGAIGPSEIISAHGSTAEDDEIVKGDPAIVTVGEPLVNGQPTKQGVKTSLMAWSPRFRYCFEKRGPTAKPGTLQLAFDVSADGAISNATAKGLDAAIQSCVTGAIFDLEILPRDLAGPMHVTVPITFARAPVAAPEPDAKPATGFFCWTHEDGESGVCARDQDQCEAVIGGYNEAAMRLGERPSAKHCVAQRTAWVPRSGGGYSPSKTLCSKGLEKGDSCKIVH